LIVSPRNTVGVRGRQTVLECVVNDTAPTWQFTDVTETPQSPVYNSGTLNPAYGARNISVNLYNMTFASVNETDTGTYTCQDGALTGAARLAVIDNDPTCTVSNITGVAAVINATCSVTVYGPIDSQTNRIEPELDWINCGASLIANATSSAPFDPSAVSPSHHLKYTIWAQISINSTAATSCKFQLSFRIMNVQRVDPRDPLYTWIWSPVPTTTPPSGTPSSTTPPSRQSGADDSNNNSAMSGSSKLGNNSSDSQASSVKSNGEHVMADVLVWRLATCFIASLLSFLL
jgi:hypothetical protein